MKPELLSGLSAINWEEVVKDVNLDGMVLSDETKRIAQFFFELGHKTGQEAMYDVLKDTYESDPDMIIEIFDDRFL